MATSAPPPVYWTQGQPDAAQPEVQPVVKAPLVAPGTVSYQHGNQQIVMVRQLPDYDYKPSSYMVFSIIMTVLCCLFSPLMLTLTVPAIMLAQRSQVSYKKGNIKLARNQGVVAAYLNVFAVIIAFVVAIVATYFVITRYSPVYYLRGCEDNPEPGETGYREICKLA